MLVELAVGDAYGACFEYADEAFVARHNTVAGYLQHPTHRDLRPGCYTDDTQMTIAVTEALLSGEPWTTEMLADRFVLAFRRDQRAGYSGGFHALLRQVRDGQELLDRIEPASDRSGAAMRAGPIGLLPDVPEVLHRVDVQARITHDTDSGVDAARAAALAVHYCHYDLGPVAQVGAWVDDRLRAAGGSGGWARPWHGPVGEQGWKSVRAALTALAAHDSLTGVLRACVAFTGDVDTVATIALGAAARSPQITADLPQALLDGMENGRYGHSYLRELDTRLMTWAARYGIRS
ncbi:MAG: ADP-ribosylglycohydrolase family protein [Thermocrispum sp.]